MDLSVPHAPASANAPAEPSPARRSPWPRRIMLLALVATAAAIVGWQWWSQRPAPLPVGIAKSNGRLEATTIDVATKLPGRVKEVFVREGDSVEASQPVALMDVAALAAEHRQAEAQRALAGHAVETANATVAQRASELDLAQSTYDRSVELVARGFVSAQKLDTDRAQMLAARASLVAARSRVVEARAAVDAADAAVNRIAADIADARLVAPRAGRVQYRLAQPGEVLGAGGKVVTMLDLADVYMTVFLDAAASGGVAIGDEARIVFDADPRRALPATVSFVAEEAQFTPKAVETTEERQKLVFRVKARLEPQVLEREGARIKAGMPGVAYVRTRPGAPWPAALEASGASR